MGKYEILQFFAIFRKFSAVPHHQTYISHWLWMSLLQQCYGLTCYSVIGYNVASVCLSSTMYVLRLNGAS